MFIKYSIYNLKGDLYLRLRKKTLRWKKNVFKLKMCKLLLRWRLMLKEICTQHIWHLIEPNYSNLNFYLYLKCCILWRPTQEIHNLLHVQFISEYFDYISTNHYHFRNMIEIMKMFKFSRWMISPWLVASVLSVFFLMSFISINSVSNVWLVQPCQKLQMPKKVIEVKKYWQRGKLCS